MEIKKRYISVICGLLMCGSRSVASFERRGYSGRRDKDTSLHRAVNNKDVRAVSQLSARKNVNINAHGTNGKTPLHCAVVKQHDGIVSRLLWAKANVDATDDDGNTPLRPALSGEKSIVEALVKAQANVNARSKSGITVLYHAVHCGTPEIVQLLLDAKANPHARIQGEDTPLHNAAHCGKVEVAKVLVRGGADVDARNRLSYRPLDIARRRGNGNMIQFLESHDKSQKSCCTVVVYGACLLLACAALWYR